MTLFYCGNTDFVMKYINNFIRKRKCFHHHFPLLYLSCVKPNNSHMLLDLNGLNTWIEHLVMFWNICNFILWKESVKKLSICFDDSKSVAFIPGQSEKQFKIQYHYGFLILQLDRDNNMMIEHHTILDVFVNLLEIFVSCIKYNLY